MSEFNVSVEKIQLGVDYIEAEFMKPLQNVGMNVLDGYRELNKSLQSEAINNIITEQENKLDEIQTDLKTVIDNAKESMTESSQVINQNQESIDETLSQL